MTLFGVSFSHATLSVPARSWQLSQSNPSAADINPIVAMKSSTGMPFNACTFLNTSSAIGTLAGAGDCALTIATINAEPNSVDMIPNEILAVLDISHLPGRRDPHCGRFFGNIVARLEMRALCKLR